MSVTKLLGMPTGPAQVFTRPPECLSSISRSRTQLASHAQDRARNTNATFHKSRHPRAAPVYQPHSLRTTRRSPLSNPPTPVRPPRGRCSRLAASSSGRAALSMLASCSPCRDVHRVCIYYMPVYVCRSAYVQVCVRTPHIIYTDGCSMQRQLGDCVTQCQSVLRVPMRVQRPINPSTWPGRLRRHRCRFLRT